MAKAAQLFKSKSARDYFFTFAVEIFIALSSLIVFRLASTNLTEEGFSEYAVSRRMLSTLQPFLVLGLGVAIPRFISMAVTQAGFKNAGNYFYASLFIVTIPIFIFFMASIIFPNSLAHLFFGDEKFNDLIFPLALMVAGLLMHVVVYGYYRGTLQMSKANIAQFINLGIVPVVVFFIASTSGQVLAFTAFSWIGVSTFFLVAQITKAHFDKSEIKKSAKELLVYGLPRVPGDFLLGLFLALPVILVNHEYGLIMGGYVTVALTFLNMAGALFAPICLMLLTDVSQLLVKRDFEQIKRRTNLVLKVTIGLTLFGIALVELLCPFVISEILKVKGTIAIESTRIVILAAMGYTVYVSLRSVLDAYYVKPVNTINIAISVAIFAGTALFYRVFHFGYIYILTCFIGSMFILGLLTYIETRKIMIRNNA